MTMIIIPDGQNMGPGSSEVSITEDGLTVFFGIINGELMVTSVKSPDGRTINEGDLPLGSEAKAILAGRKGVQKVLF